MPCSRSASTASSSSTCSPTMGQWTASASDSATWRGSSVLPRRALLGVRIRRGAEHLCLLHLARVAAFRRCRRGSDRRRRRRAHRADQPRHQPGHLPHQATQPRSRPGGRTRGDQDRLDRGSHPALQAEPADALRRLHPRGDLLRRPFPLRGRRPHRLGVRPLQRPEARHRRRAEGRTLRLDVDARLQPAGRARRHQPVVVRHLRAPEHGRNCLARRGLRAAARLRPLVLRGRAAGRSHARKAAGHHDHARSLRRDSRRVRPRSPSIWGRCVRSIPPPSRLGPGRRSARCGASGTTPARAVAR